MSQTLITTTCNVPTAHASRYLQQLCKHWTHKFEVSFDATHGTIAMAEDRIITLDATADHLQVRLNAPDEVTAHLQQVIDKHIARFAFREELVFDWQPI